MRFALALLVAAGALALTAPLAGAHGVADKDQRFIETHPGPQPIPFLYLGAKHMVTGYDHLLFLLGVLFFLHRAKDVVLYASLFTLGHSTTLLLGVLLQIPANAYLIDAIIGLSVVYKALDNLNGFQTLVGWRPDPKTAVLVFGLFHGLGLSTKLQDLRVSHDGLVVNLVSFNLGVELGQFLALAFILLGITYWRSTRSFDRHAVHTNVLIMAGGFVLIGYQLAGYAQGG